MMNFGEIIAEYSKYTGTGIFMVLFFVCLVVIAVSDKNHSNRNVLLFGSIFTIIVIFFPVMYFLYTKFVDETTYWRMWWLVPMGIGLAYVGTNLIKEHRVTGLLLGFFILILGGRFVYTSDPMFHPAANAYKIDETIVAVCDYLDGEEEGYLNVAMPAEFLTQVRQYDYRIFMPYGREQLDAGWGKTSGFYEAMNKDVCDFEVLEVKCAVNNTNYIVVNNIKTYLNSPEEYGFVYKTTIGSYDIFEYTRLPVQ